MPALVFADFTCPFCYVTEAALRRLADEGRVAPSLRALELYPAPAPLPFDGFAQRVEAARPLADELGLALRTPAVLPRTRKAHEAALFAAEKGLGREMREALYHAFFADGLDVGRIDVLVRLAEELGLDATETKVVLDIDRMTEQVVRDAEEARSAGIRGVPTVVLGTAAAERTLTGAWSLAELRAALDEE
ncbi:MAG: thioredoxin domain protein [Gemmatimonadetes bacterium]|nr:thioredoxin domain protein [Gemmatimonadota bacterium]